MKLTHSWNIQALKISTYHILIYKLEWPALIPQNSTALKLSRTTTREYNVWTMFNVFTLLYNAYIITVLLVVSLGSLLLKQKFPYVSSPFTFGISRGCMRVHVDACSRQCISNRPNILVSVECMKTDTCHVWIPPQSLIFSPNIIQFFCEYFHEVIEASQKLSGHNANKFYAELCNYASQVSAVAAVCGSDKNTTKLCLVYAVFCIWTLWWSRTQADQRIDNLSVK